VIDEACRNCARPLTGPFCAHCGQRVVPPHPTVREVAGDAYDELVGWDGKFARTLKLLVTRPGVLTRDAVEGRRARYISPVRLYLMCSVAYFLFAALAPSPVENANDGAPVEFGIGFGVGPPTDATPADAAVGRAITNGLANLTPADRALVEAEIAELPPSVQPMMRAMVEDYDGLMRRASESMPRVLFALIPALALILAIFHRRRHFPEHLYFALHFEAFIFATLCLSTLVAYARSPVATLAGQLLVGVWILVYGIVAQRRVYGGSWAGNIAKGFGVGAVYLVLWSVTVSGVTLWVSRT
jgi:hypothetical protein